MLFDQSRVEEMMRAIRPDWNDHAIMLGQTRADTDAQQELINFVATLANHVPLFCGFVIPLKNYPVYIAYSGQERDEIADYRHNAVLLHETGRDDQDMVQIPGVLHEAAHGFQDLLGALRLDDPVPPPENIRDFIVHYMVAEASAIASELTSLYYLSKCSALRHKVECIEDLYAEYVAETPFLKKLDRSLKGAIPKTGVRIFDDLKPAWSALFYQLMRDDSPLWNVMVPVMAERYCARLKDGAESGNPVTQPWDLHGDCNGLTTLPGWGTMFSVQEMDVIITCAKGALSLRKFDDAINRSHGVALFIFDRFGINTVPNQSRKDQSTGRSGHRPVPPHP